MSVGVPNDWHEGTSAGVYVRGAKVVYLALGEGGVILALACQRFSNEAHEKDYNPPKITDPEIQTQESVKAAAMHSKYGKGTSQRKRKDTTTHAVHRATRGTQHLEQATQTRGVKHDKVITTAENVVFPLHPN